MSYLSRDEYRAFLRQDLASFVERCFRQLNPGTPYVPGWHIDLLATWFGCCEEPGTRMIVNLPPRHLKSIAGSIALVAWLLGRDPTMRIICASYGADLAEDFSRQCRRVMESDWYKAVFPRTRLRRTTASLLETTLNGYRMATSIDGALTGYGADLIIIDDPLKPDDALSDVVRKRVNNWFDNTLFSRLNDKRTGRILVIMQRLHQDDLTGHLLARGGWHHLALPAIAETAHKYMIHFLDDEHWYDRAEGEALHPEREPLAVLQEIKRTIGEYNFAGQYQQSPTPLDGGLVKRSWFKSYGDAERPETFEVVIQSWDTANKPGELNDHSVCTTWGFVGNRIYLLHVLRKKLNFPELKRAVREQADVHKPDVILIEDKASGTQLIQELTVENMQGVQAYQPAAGMNKIMRMHAQTPAIENGLVYLPTSAAWLEDYVNEVTMFPYGKHDDQVDSTAQALHWFKMGQKPVPAIILYYEMMEKKRMEEAENVVTSW